MTQLGFPNFGTFPKCSGLRRRPVGRLRRHLVVGAFLDDTFVRDQMRRPNPGFLRSVIGEGQRTQESDDLTLDLDVFCLGPIGKF